VRRGIDLLVGQSRVDARRIGFVGHRAGAMLGAILAGTDRRASCYVLVAGTPDATEWALRSWPSAADSAREYGRALAVLNPINFVGIAAPAALLFQFGRRDSTVSEAARTELFDEASHPKEVRWYDSGHELNVEAAVADRIAWLTGHLNVRASRP
jgi:uncharacterized protein